MASVHNMEEAANIISEYISSLDNLPSEIAHLVAEMRHKESRSQELLQEIAKDSNKYVRYSIRPPAPNGPLPPNYTATPTAAKFEQISQKIALSYIEVDKLADEKILLAQRIIDTVARTRARLAVDLAQVGVLQGETIDLSSPATAVLANSASLDSFSASVKRPQSAQADTLRTVLANTDSIIAAAAGPIPTKKRKSTPTIIKLPSPGPSISTPMPTITKASHASSHSRSRLSQQVHLALEGNGLQEIDAATEAGREEAGDEDDDTIYCSCRKPSYGDMIGCDNPQCPIQWFHLGCVGLREPVAGEWFCPVCSPKRSHKKRKH